MRAELAAVAVGLFVEQGFDETTVDDIARAAGLTKRSFFRYFPTKEDAAFAGVDVLGEQVVEDLRDRPVDEHPWDGLHVVLRRWEERIRTDELAVVRVIESSPALRARLHQKREQWRRRVADVLVECGELDAFTADLLVNSAVAVLDTVVQHWMRTGADRVALLDRGFAAVRPAPLPAVPAQRP